MDEDVTLALVVVGVVVGIAIVCSVCALNFRRPPADYSVIIP
jgi:hypothetical protein